jgi:hypothetical protein
MGMRSDAEVPVRTAVAPAPDLILAGRAQQRIACVGKARRPLTGSAVAMMFCGCQGADNDAARIAGQLRPPIESADKRLGKRQ